LQVDNVEVTGLTNVQNNVFRSGGEGANVQATNVVFTDNDMRSTDSTWTGIRSSRGSRMSVRNVRFVDNYQMRSAIAVEGGAIATISKVAIDTATGTLGKDNNVSSLVFVNIDAQADANNIEFVNVDSMTVRVRPKS